MTAPLRKLASMSLPAQSISARQMLAGPTTYYVAPNGSPDNDGLTPQTPLDHVTTALTLLATSVDGCGNDVTIRMADGQYDIPMPGGYVLLPFVGIRTLTIQGNTANNQAVSIRSTGDGSLFMWYSPTNTEIVFDHLKVSNVAGKAGVLFSPNGNEAVFKSIYWGAVAPGSTPMWCSSGSNINFQGAHTIDVGSAAVFAYVMDNGFLSVEPGTVMNVVNGPGFSSGFVWVGRGGVYSTQGATYSGQATGRRYVLNARGVIDTGSGGNPNPAFLPGSVPGLNIDGTGSYV
jgi:hypothetical protein